MTDSSSEGKPEPEVVQMASELIQAKMEAARQPQSLTHLLQLGSFRMEIVPTKDIDIEKMFAETIDDLYKKFGEDVLKINMTDIMQAQKQSGNMHG